MKRFLFVLLAVILTAVLLTGCSAKQAEYVSPDGAEHIVLNAGGTFKMTHTGDDRNFEYAGNWKYEDGQIVFYAVNMANDNYIIALRYNVSPEGYLLDSGDVMEVIAYDTTEEYIYILMHNRQYDTSCLYTMDLTGTGRAIYYDSTMPEGQPLEDTYTVKGNVYHYEKLDAYIYIPADGSAPCISYYAPKGHTTYDDLLPKS